MREIQFRQAIYVDDKFHHWHHWGFMPDLSFVGPDSVNGLAHALDNSCQSTGLKDKNGKEIYEGDRIKGKMDYGPGGFVEREVPIRWHNEYGYQWNYFDLSTIEIIGNIHDIPELRSK